MYVIYGKGRWLFHEGHMISLAELLIVQVIGLGSLHLGIPSERKNPPGYEPNES